MLLTKYFNEIAEVNRKQDGVADIKNHEDSLDGLIRLYEIVGRIFEESKDKAKDVIMSRKPIYEQVESACNTSANGRFDTSIDASFNADDLFRA